MNLNQAIKKYFKEKFSEVEVEEKHYTFIRNNETTAIGEINYIVKETVTGYYDIDMQIIATEELKRKLFYEFDYKTNILTLQNLNNQYDQTKYNKARIINNEQNIDFDVNDEKQLKNYFDHNDVIKNHANDINLKNRHVELKVDLEKNNKNTQFLLQTANQEQIDNTVTKFKKYFTEAINKEFNNQIDFSFNTSVDKNKQGVKIDNMIFGNKKVDFIVIGMVTKDMFKFNGNEIEPDEEFQNFSKEGANFIKNLIISSNYQKEINQSIEKAINHFADKIDPFESNHVTFKIENVKILDTPILVHVKNEYLFNISTTIELKIKFLHDGYNEQWTGDAFYKIGIYSQYINETMKHTFKLIESAGFENFGPYEVLNPETQQSIGDKLIEVEKLTNESSEYDEELETLRKTNKDILNAFREFNDSTESNTFDLNSKII